MRSIAARTDGSKVETVATTFGDLRGRIDEWALGADALVEVVLPRFATAFEGDDRRRFVLEVQSEIGLGSESSSVRLCAEAPGGPCVDVVDVGQMLGHAIRARVPDDARVTVLIEGEPDDRADGEWDVLDVGAVRPSDAETLPTLVLRLESS